MLAGEAMRIFSKFQDYYDIGLSYGIDPKLIYHRTTSLNVPFSFVELTRTEDFHDLNHLVPTIHRKGETIWASDNISTAIVLFCGKLYFGIRVNGNFSDRENSRWFWNTEQAASYVEKCDDKLLKAAWQKKDKKRGRWTRTRYFNEENLDKIYRKVAEFNEQKNFTQYHLDAGAPIIAAIDCLTNVRVGIHGETRQSYSTKFKVNPELKKLNFASAVDPYTAFQEVSMYLSGVIGIGEPETIDVSNESKIAKHGYNENSFRHPVK